MARLRLAFEVGKSAEERIHGDLRLDARERRAETEVDAVTERQMIVVFAAEIEPIGIREATRVAIGRTEKQESGPTCP